MSLTTLLETACNQTVVLWAYQGVDGFAAPSYTNPVEKMVRWVEEFEVMRDDKGDEFTSHAKIIFKEVVSVKDILFLGSLSDLTEGELENPLTIDSAYIVKVISKKPRLKEGVFLIYEARLGRR